MNEPVVRGPAVAGPAVAGPAAGRPPPRVLALPTSTTLRMVVVAVALAVSALFVGVSLHNAFFYRAWHDAVQACLPPGALLPSSPEQLACQAPAQRRFAAAALSAALVAVLLAAAVAVVVPAVVRRRRRLVPADPRFAHGVAATARLARAAGVRPPGVLIVPGARAEPFCVGRRVAIPRKLALHTDPRGFALFDALIGHEVAHLAHRDVTVSWLARSLGYVLGPLLALPVVVSAVTGEPWLALEILWRGGVLVGVVLLVVRGLMRAREHDADLRAADLFGVGPVLAAELAGRPRERRRWRTALAWHPPATDRRAVLADPARATAVTWLDGLTLGVLVAVAQPIVDNVVSTGLYGSDQVVLVAALVLGPLFGAALGVGLWRHALAARTAALGPGVGAVALGVLGGALLGQLTSLSGVGLGVPQPRPLVPLALAGVTVLVGGLGELWVSGVGRSRRPAAVWVPGMVLGAAAAVAALWAAPLAQIALDESGWAVVALWLTTPGALVLPGAVAVALAVATGWALRSGRDGGSPRWWEPVRPGASEAWPVDLYRSGSAGATTGRGTLLAGLAAGAAGGLGCVAFRLMSDPPGGVDEVVQRVDAAALGGALVGTAVVVVLGLVRGPAGAAAGLLAGPVAAVLTVGGFLAVSWGEGDPLPAITNVLGGAVAAGLLLAVPAALVAAVPLPRVRSTAVVVVAVLIVGAATGYAALVARRTLVPGLAAIPGYTETDGVPSVTVDVTRDTYPHLVALPLLEGRRTTADSVAALQRDKPSNGVAATRIRSDILPTLQAMRELAESVRTDDLRVTDVHAHAVAGARGQLAGFEDVATALERGDRALLQQGNKEIAEANTQWQQWAAGVADL